MSNVADKPEGETVIIGNFEVALTLTDKRTFKMSGYIYNRDTAAAVNARVDMAQDALDRQAVRCDVANKEAQVDNLLQNLDFHRQHFENLVMKKTQAEKTGKKLTSVERQSIDKFDADVRGCHMQIESLRAAISKGRARLNGAAGPE